MPIDIPMIDIETVKGCNLACRWCTVEGKSRHRFMEKDLFQRIIRETVRHRIGYRRVSLFLGGEPLLHPAFPEFLEIMREAGMHRLGYENIQIFTNGVTNPQYYEDIVQSGVIGLVRFSIDGCGDRESYEHMRPPAKWDDLMANLRQMINLRNQHNPAMSVCLTTLIPHQSFVPFPVPDYEEAVRRFDDTFAGIGVDEIGHRKIGTLIGKQIDIPTSYYPKKRLCLLVKDRKLAVNFDGTVSTCSNDLSSRQLLGSLNGSGLAETWDSPRFQDFYSRKAAGEKNPLGFCGDCDRNHA